MDKYVKMSIDSRKQAIFSSYEVPDKMKQKIDELFKEIEKLGATAKDTNDFETKFAASPLNKRYTDIFVELATPGAPSKGESIAEAIAGGVAGRVADDVKRRVLPTRAAVNQKVYDEARKIPGVGDTLHVKQYVDLFGGFRKKKKGDND